MFCPECGGANPDTAKFCVRCGTGMPPAPSSTPLSAEPAWPAPVVPPPAEAKSDSSGLLRMGCAIGLVLAAALLLVEDLAGNDIGWFWRVVMMALIVIAYKLRPFGA